MIFTMTKCAKCATEGTTNILPWVMSPGNATGFSINCSACGFFGILDAKAAVAIDFSYLLPDGGAEDG